MSLLPTIGVAVVSIIALLVQQPVPATTAAAQLQVGGEVATPLTLSVNDLKKLPRTRVKVLNPLDHKEEIYEGVAVQELLGRAGVPQKRETPRLGDGHVRSRRGFRRISRGICIGRARFGFQDSGVIIADTMNGAPLGEKQGPFKMVAPHDKRSARSICMLKSITVVTAPSK